MLNQLQINKHINVLSIMNSLFTINKRSDCIDSWHYGLSICPLCDGKDDNELVFRLFPDVGFGEPYAFHCYMCDEAGSIISLVCEVRKCNSVEAILWVNEIINKTVCPIPHEDSKECIICLQIGE